MAHSPFHGIFSFGTAQDKSFEQPQDASTTTELPAPHIESAPEKPAQTKSAVGQIAVDIYELEDYYIIRAPIAGVRMIDLDIEVDDKVITIRGSRRLEGSVPSNQYYLQECFWGEFSRSITMPCSVDPKKIKATFSKDCILKILIPKEERVKIVRINEGN